MDLVVVGKDQAATFSRFLNKQGHQAKLILLSAGDLPSLNSDIAGVVIFVDTACNAGDWIVRARNATQYLSVPVVVVSGSEEMEQAKLTAAGAASILPPDAPFDKILAEISERANIQPVMAEIETALLQPFMNATTLTIKEMAGIEVTSQAIYQKTGYKMFGDISAVIGLTGRGDGSMVLSFSESTAKVMVKRILAEVSDEPGVELIRDCVGEIANVIAGQARGMLANTPYNYNLSTPTIVCGAGHEIRHKLGMPCMVIAFESSAGQFALQLCIGI